MNVRKQIKQIQDDYFKYHEKMEKEIVNILRESICKIDENIIVDGYCRGRSLNNIALTYNGYRFWVDINPFDKTVRKSRTYKRYEKDAIETKEEKKVWLYCKSVINKALELEY